MRKSVRSSLVGAALLPLAVAAPGMAFAGSTGYDEGGSDQKQHSHAGEHKDGEHKDGHKKHHKHDKKHDGKKWEHKEEKKAESPLPEPLAGAVEMITGAAPELPVG